MCASRTLVHTLREQGVMSPRQCAGMSGNGATSSPVVSFAIEPAEKQRRPVCQSSCPLGQDAVDQAHHRGDVGKMPTTSVRVDHFY